MFLSLNLEKAYLIVGNGLSEIVAYEAYISSVDGIFFYVVGAHRVIDVDGAFYCSCNGSLCTHTIKVLLERPRLVYRDALW